MSPVLCLHPDGNPAVHASCFGIRLRDTRLLVRGCACHHDRPRGQQKLDALQLASVQKNPHERTVFAGLGVWRRPNDHKTTAQVGCTDVAVGITSPQRRAYSNNVASISSSEKKKMARFLFADVIAKKKCEELRGLAAWGPRVNVGRTPSESTLTHLLLNPLHLGGGLEHGGIWA
jgi:hypothetical protein